MKTLEEFQDFFENSLKTDLINLDVRRKRIVKRFLIITVFFILASVACAVLNFFWGIAIAFVVALIVFALWVYDKHFYKDFKHQVINRIVYFISPDMIYDSKGRINISEFTASRIFLTNIDRYNGDDLVSGKMDKTEMRFSEIKAEYKVTTTDGKGNRKTTWHTIFKGLFFIADFNKEFVGSTVVIPNSFGKGFGFLKKLMGINRREKLVQLEDVNFTKNFNVYGDDQIQARYILSTTLMERILEFKNKHKKSIYLSFVDSKMYLAVPYTKDLFEPSYLKSLVNIKVIGSYFEDLQLATGIVDDMNLNLRIWTKQ
ncbi:MAG: DUF3137 domain-containing protein [Bacteroidales bacterium]|nr:DUF3137 domain-containing protein [Bacteroidales bacterium]